MARARNHRLRGGVLPGLLAALALVLVVAALWWWLGRPRQAVAPAASDPAASAAASAPASGAGPLAFAQTEPQAPAGGAVPADALRGDGEEAVSAPAALAAYRDAVAAQRRGDGASALIALEKAVELEPGNAFLLEAAGRQAWALGRLAEAASLYERALAAEEQSSGSVHPRAAAAMSRLAGVYADQQRYADAEELYLRALGILEQASGPLHREGAEAQIRLASLYRQQGRNDEALTLFEAALEAERDVSAEKDPKSAELLSAMGMLHAEVGRYDEARASLEESVALFEAKLGPEHPVVADQLIVLGRMALSQWRFEEAKPYYDRAYAIEGRVLEGPNSRVTNELVRQAAEMHAKGDGEEARSILTFGRQRSEEVFGPGHTSTQVLEKQLVLLDRISGGR